MASIQDFVSEVERVPGVKGYLLVASDGRTLAQTLDNAEQLGSMMVLTLLAADKVRVALGLERLRHLVVGRTDESCLVVFPLGRYLLAVRQDQPAGNDLAQAIHDLVGQFQAKTKH